MSPIDTYTPDELEALYNNRAAVPEHVEIF